jgi:tetratricopeptide (TPR) repeat protein
MRKTIGMAAVIAAMICTSLTATAATPGEFYTSLLRRGVSAFDAGRLDEATQHLRLAAFGLIENIEQYQTAHAYLAATYERSGMTDRARDSVRRIAQAERVQPRFAALKLPAPVKTTVEKLAAIVLTPAELAGLRGTAAMPPRPPGQGPAARTTTVDPPVTVERVEVEEVKPATPQTHMGTNHNPPAPATGTTTPVTPPPSTTVQPPRPTTTTPSTSTPATTTTAPATSSSVPRSSSGGTEGPEELRGTPRNPASTTQTPAQTTTVQPRTTPPQTSTATTTTPPRPGPAYTAAERAARFAAAEKALNTSNLAEARRIYSELMGSQGVDRATYIRIAEGFYRARDFAAALAAFDRAGGLRRTEEPYRYYIAVALYETGQYERAKRELAAALPYIEITPDVARYRAKIQSAIQ